MDGPAEPASFAQAFQNARKEAYKNQGVFKAPAADHKPLPSDHKPHAVNGTNTSKKNTHFETGEQALTAPNDVTPPVSGDRVDTKGAARTTKAAKSYFHEKGSASNVFPARETHADRVCSLIQAQLTAEASSAGLAESRHAKKSAATTEKKKAAHVAKKNVEPASASEPADVPKKIAEPGPAMELATADTFDVEAAVAKLRAFKAPEMKSTGRKKEPEPAPLELSDSEKGSPAKADSPAHFDGSARDAPSEAFSEDVKPPQLEFSDGTW